MKTFYWYDYETFGINSRTDRIAQFAGIRTDENGALGQNSPYGKLRMFPYFLNRCYLH